jgi:hypothetical protein
LKTALLWAIKGFAYDTGAVSFMKGGRPVIRVMLAIPKERWRNASRLY